MTYDFLDGTVTVVEPGGYFVFDNDFHYMGSKEFHIDQEGNIFTCQAGWDALRPALH